MCGCFPPPTGLINKVLGVNLQFYSSPTRYMVEAVFILVRRTKLTGSSVHSNPDFNYFSAKVGASQKFLNNSAYLR